MPYFYFDYYYIILVVPVIIVSLIIQAKLKSTYARYSKVGNMRGITGAQAAKTVLNYCSSIAAVGIACHEAGHAAQHAESYAPIRIRNLILPVCNIGSTLSMPLLVLGLILGFAPLVWIGIGFFGFTAVFQFVTLPVEFNASNRAINVIESNGLLSYEEKDGASKVLKAAAMTYVAALAVSVANLLRLILRFNGRRR